jgi:hypothetical protein
MMMEIYAPEDFLIILLLPEFLAEFMWSLKFRGYLFWWGVQVLF